MTTGRPPIFQCVDVRKGFSGVAVLKGITLDLPAGHALGLVGENGAGKSTLLNLLGGNLQPDSGQMFVDGQGYEPRSPLDATRAGIAFIHQELNLFPNLSIADNLFLTAFPTRFVLPWIDRAALQRRAAEFLAEVGLEVEPDTRVENLSAGEQQLVEVARALASEARIILFDEPTTSLTRVEASRLFDLIRRLRARGVALIYISHHLEDVLSLCDSIAVLRDGERVAWGPRTEFDADRLVTHMVGRKLSQLFPRWDRCVASEPLLEVRNLSQAGTIEGIEFTLHRGEVLGLSGLMGSGRSELARILFGLDPVTQGEIAFKGRSLRPAPGRNLAAGIAFLTEDRRDEGLCLDASIADNIALVTLRDHAALPSGWLNRVSIGRAVKMIREAVRITPAAPDSAPARTLSGGNQQKTVLAKWLLARPQMLILDEPTRGIDVGAKSEIYQLIGQLASEGTGILIISSELEELAGLCDRILVMRRGEIAGQFHRGAFDRERILTCALGASEP